MRMAGATDRAVRGDERESLLRRIVLAAAKYWVCKRATGHAAESVNYCTEAPFVQQLGCDTLVLGPGHITQAHQPDEYLDLSFVTPTKEVLQHLIRKFCL